MNSASFSLKKVSLRDTKRQFMSKFSPTYQHLSSSSLLWSFHFLRETYQFHREQLIFWNCDNFDTVCMALAQFKS